MEYMCMTGFTRPALVALMMSAGVAAAQTPNPHYDLNLYPSVNGATSPYNLNVAPTQNGPAGTVVMTSTAPPPAYSFQDVLANTHGYVSTGVATHGGHEFSGGVTIPLVPGRADLSVGASSGQVGGFPSVTAGGKSSTLRYDSYYAGLHLHPTDDIDAFIGVSGLRLHGPDAPYGFGPYALP
jgi:hypothetical protein